VKRGGYYIEKGSEAEGGGRFQMLGVEANAKERPFTVEHNFCDSMIFNNYF